MKRFINPWFLVLAGMLAMDLLIWTGLIGGWGQWYSSNAAYRRQTKSLLRGSLALDTDPRQIQWDLAWAGGGVQQVWGLGVPIWQLPFEAIARIFGQPAFPDRLTFGVAVMATAYLLMHSFWGRAGSKQSLGALFRDPESCLAVPLLLLFPPFLTLCRTRFAVYEEAAAYSYLASISLLALTVSFTRHPTFVKFSGLSLVAGCIVFVRPTLIVYGVASIIVSFMWTRHLKWTWLRSLCGICLFCLGGLLLAVTNFARFDSPFEFGHRLNLDNINALMFATRFDHPFRQEPLGSASRELFASLFLLGSDLNGTDWYKGNFFTGQSGTVRWREFYFTAFDISYLLAALGSWVLIGWRLLRSRPQAVQRTSYSESYALASWSILSMVPLWLFYLRYACITSRYLLDFAPGLAAAALAGLCAIRPSFRERTGFGAGMTAVAYCIFLMWWGYEVSMAAVVLGSPQSFRQSDALAFLPKKIVSSQPLPDAYELGMELNSYSIQFNGLGWRNQTGETDSMVAFYLESPAQLEIELAPANGVELSPVDYDCVQAKIGLESLILLSNVESRRGRILTFTGPQTKTYQHGVQVAFIALAQPTEMSTGKSKFRLLRVRWR